MCSRVVVLLISSLWCGYASFETIPGPLVSRERLPVVSKAAQNSGSDDGFPEEEGHYGPQQSGAYSQYTSQNNYYASVTNPPGSYPNPVSYNNQGPTQQQAINQNNYFNNGNPNNRAHFYLRVPPPEMRDPSSCEPYEDVVIDEDSCLVHCMLNGRLGAVFLRDQVRRTLQRCLGPTQACSLCRINTTNAMVSTLGRCHEGCQCRSLQQTELFRLDEDAKECATAKHFKHLPLRKPISDTLGQDVEVFFPPEQSRNPQLCEPYESLSLTVSPGDELVTLLQCQSFCVVQGSIGLLSFRSQPRVIGPNFSFRCIGIYDRPYSRNVQLAGAYESLQGTCGGGFCTTEAGPYPNTQNNPYNQAFLTRNSSKSQLMVANYRPSVAPVSMPLQSQGSRRPTVKTG